MLKGSTPLNPSLSSIDTSGLEKASLMQQQAIIEANNQIQKTVVDFTEKMRKKEEQEMRMQALAPILEQSQLAGPVGTKTFDNALISLSKDANFLNTLTSLQQSTMERQVQEAEIAKLVAETQQEQLQPVYTGVDLENVDTYLDLSVPGNPRIVQGGTAKESGVDNQGTQFFEGGTYAVDSTTGEVSPINQNFILYNTSDVGANRQRLGESQNNINKSVGELNGLSRYLDSRGRLAKDGATRIINKIKANFKTVFGIPLEGVEIEELKAQGLFRQQLGNLRVAVLGPGVMTEFDRQVLEQAIGGLGAGSNIEVVKDLIEPVIQQKVREVEQNMQTFNDIISISPRLQREFKSYNADNLIDKANVRQFFSPSENLDQEVNKYEGMRIIN